MPNLSLARITATLALLTAACGTKKAPDPIQKTTDLVATSAPSSAAATATAVAQPPAPVATAASPGGGSDAAAAVERGKKPSAIGSAGGQMSCGAGSCSGSVAPKKK